MPLLDVRFFSTAVLIQRETGGNLSEILDNLAGVVRERFKIRRQVRVHTAHGRFTGYVLMALPAFLALALSFINPEHMNLLFEERIGQMMIVASHRHAGDRLHLDQTSREDRGVAVTMLLPLLAFVFGSLLVTAVTYALTARSAGHQRPASRRRRRQRSGRCPYQDASAEQIVAFLKRIGERAAEIAEGAGQAPAAPRAGRLSRRRGAAGVPRHPRRLRARVASRSS